MNPQANIHDSILFTKPYPQFKGMVMHGLVLKIWHEEKCYIVACDYGLDFVKYKEVIQINKKS